MTWQELLDSPFDREPHRTTLVRAEAAARSNLVYPPREQWFAAFERTPPDAVRVVILGQDTYHEPGQAMGLAFSVRPGVPLPPSLRNMYRELCDDLGHPAPADGDLTPWAKQGVLLLNTVLTVEAGKANSHRDLGWQAFTLEVLSALTRLPQPIAFVLWGAQAKRTFEQASGAGKPANGPLVGTGPAPGPRLILESPHPSPLSAYRGFFGSRPYSRINAFLRGCGQPEIRWCERTEGEQP